MIDNKTVDSMEDILGPDFEGLKTFALVAEERLFANLWKKEKEVVDVIAASAGRSTHLFWIAGGFVRDALTRSATNKNSPGDIDIFTSAPDFYRRDEKDLEEVPLINSLLKFDYKIAYKNENMITLKKKGYLKIQIVLRQPMVFVPIPHDSLLNITNCLNEFHFTHSMMAYEPKAKTVIVLAEGLIDAMQKRIVVNHINKLWAVDSVAKLGKYLNRGYTLCAKESANLIRKLQGMGEEEIKQQEQFYWDGSLRQSSRFD